jgi:hypothetical protein
MISANEARSNICEYENERENKLVKLERELTLLVDNEIKNAMEKINAAIKKESLENGKTVCFVNWDDFGPKLIKLGCIKYGVANTDNRERLKTYDNMFDDKIRKLLNGLGYVVFIEINDGIRLENGNYIRRRLIKVSWKLETEEKTPVPIPAPVQDTAPVPVPVAEQIKEKNCIIC